MKKIISASRRTDIPAFYGKWFMNRLEDGFVGHVNPSYRQKYIVSLKQENVLCFVFWSKNFGPFIEELNAIKEKGYNCYFHYTLTGLPNIFECNLAEIKYAIESLKTLSEMFSPRHVQWRYDPIIVSNITDYNFHLENFEYIASAIQGCVERCYFGFVKFHKKVKSNFSNFQKETQITILKPGKNYKISLANDLAEIAKRYGMSMHTCCDDFLVNSSIERAHCTDGDRIKELFCADSFRFAPGNLREGCGCVANTDIGTYDTCGHGCGYCYANLNKRIAFDNFKKHDPNSKFLGYSKEVSDEWIRGINNV